jgi:hypothetical protein
MPSVYESAAMRLFDENCEQDSQWLSIAADTSVKLRQRYYSREVVDALGQYFMSPPLHEVFSFLQLWTHLHTGEVAAVRLYMGQTPFADSNIEANNAALQKIEKCSGIRCRAEFWGGLSDSDGFIQVEEPIELSTISLEIPNVTIEHGGADSLSFPLEVGYQAWSKSLVTLRQVGLLARWPYDSKDLWLFKIRDEVRTAMQDRIVGMLTGSD